MKRYWIVAHHEFITQIRRRSFLVMVFLLPLMVAGMSLLPGLLSAQKAEETGSLGRIGIVDLSGLLAAEKERPSEYVTFSTANEAAQALQNKEIGAYFVVPDDYLAQGSVQAYADKTIPLGIQNQFQTYLETNLLANRSPIEVERLRNPAEISMATLDGRVHVNEETVMVMLLTPIIFAVLFVMSISITSSLMMQTVVEEKETRMVEMITTSITPLELLWGKIIGLSALGLLQLAVWILIGAVTIIARQDVAQMLADINYPLWLLVIAVIYLILGYILFGSLMSGVGASSTSMQEAQPLAAILSILGITPIYFLNQFLVNSNGFMPTFFSLFPLTAPTAMILRLVLGQVPWWQVGASLALMAAALALVIWLAAWVFRIGLLMTGQRLTPRALLTAIRQNSQEPAAKLAFDSRRPS